MNCVEIYENLLTFYKKMHNNTEHLTPLRDIAMHSAQMWACGIDPEQLVHDISYDKKSYSTHFSWLRFTKYE